MGLFINYKAALVDLADVTFLFDIFMELLFLRRLTDTPIHLMDGVSVDTVTTCPSEGCRGKHGRVHLHEREKKQERPL